LRGVELLLRGDPHAHELLPRVSTYNTHRPRFIRTPTLILHAKQPFNMFRLSFAIPSSRCFDIHNTHKYSHYTYILIKCFDYLSHFLPHGILKSIMCMHIYIHTHTYVHSTHIHIKQPFNVFRLSFAIPSSRCRDKLSMCPGVNAVALVT
jgi:hypothetical protein